MTQHDDALDRVLSAYAGATAGSALDAELVRARIVRSVRTTPPRSLRRVSFVLPLVAVFVASAAFAASQPELRAAISTRLEQLLGVPHTPREAAPGRQPLPAASAFAAKRTSEAVVPPAAAPEATPGADAAAPIPIDSLPLAQTSRDSPSTVLPATPRRDLKAVAAPATTPPADEQAELEAYRTAHRVHFDGGSPAASLAAWNRYLDDFPGGSFADDARFNRALCLIRLGRHAEARTALAPFAAAPAGSYRQTEAASLLRSLPSAQP